MKYRKSENCCINFGKIPKYCGKKNQILNLTKIEIQQSSGNFCKILIKTSAIVQQFLTKKLKLENGAKRVAAAYELLLAIFPGVGPGSFPPMAFLVFWDSIPKRCKGVHCVDLG